MYYMCTTHVLNVLNAKSMLHILNSICGTHKLYTCVTYAFYIRLTHMYKYVCSIHASNNISITDTRVNNVFSYYSFFD